jgi:hypothetical protein
MEAISLPEDNLAHTIFFSHKQQDEPVTKEIISILRSHTENVQCFISEDIEKGTNWRKAIAEHLALSSFLILVFSDPEEDWGWCLYETGFFDALSQIPSATQSRRIYCLHNPSTTPPSPIADLQAISANTKDITLWLKEIFELTNQANEGFKKEIPKLSERISALFVQSHKQVYSAKSLDLIFKCSLQTSPDDLPDDAIIQGDASLMDEIFCTENKTIDWKSAKLKIGQFPSSSETNFRTLKEISRAACCICSGNRVPTIQGTLFVGEGPKRYRPIISHAKEISFKTFNCQILLVEEVGGPLQNVDKDLRVLLTTIRMAVRIRWEIVRQFASIVRESAQIDPLKLRFDLQTSLNNIFSEAEFRGSYSPGDVLTAFDSKEDQAKMADMIEKSKITFANLWRGIGFSDPMETFGDVSSQPFVAEDVALLDNGLAELSRMNGDFLKMAVVRADALIQKELGDSNG